MAPAPKALRRSLNTGTTSKRAAGQSLAAFSRIVTSPIGCTLHPQLGEQHESKSGLEAATIQREASGSSNIGRAGSFSRPHYSS
jgi:hypothetical protein